MKNRPRPAKDNEIFTDVVISTLEEVSDDALEEIAVYVDEWAEKNGIGTPGLSAHKCNDEFETFHSMKEERDELKKANARLQGLLAVQLPRDVREMAQLAVDFNVKLREAYIRLATHAVEHNNNGLCPEGPEDPARDPDCQVCRLITLFTREEE